MKYGNRSIWKSSVLSPLLLVVVLFVFIVLAKATWSIHQKALVSDDKLTQAQSELDRLTSQRETLLTRVGYLSTEKGTEAELRTKYRAVKDGESVAVIVDKSQTASADDAISSSEVEKVGWFRKLLQKFGF